MVVDLDEADQGADTGRERIMPDNIEKGELHACCFEGGYGLFAEVCSHGMRESGGM